MPYIDKELRHHLDDNIEQFIEYINRATPDKRDGITNYIISRIVTEGLKLPNENLRYYTAQDMIGVLECAKLEVYRRMVAPYEDKAIDKNGDIPAYIPDVPDRYRYFIHKDNYIKWCVVYDKLRDILFHYHSGNKSHLKNWDLDEVEETVKSGSWIEISEQEAKERINNV